MIRNLVLCLAASLMSAAEGVTIVSSLPRTGSAATQTSTMVNAIRMALDEAGGKAGPFTVSYEDWDDASPEKGQWDAAVEATNADKAIRNPDVLVYIGPYNSGAAKISIPKLNQAGLAMIAATTTWPGLTKPGTGEANEPAIYRPSGKPNFFRVVPSDDIQGLVAAQWAAEMGVKKVTVLHDGELYGKGVAKMFRAAAEKQGIAIAAFEGIDGKASNYRSLVTKIRQQAPDLVYCGCTTETGAGQLAKDLAAAGVSAKLMLPDGCLNQALIDSAGAANLEERVLLTFGGVPVDQQEGRGKAFVAAYRARYGKDPEAYALCAYDAAKAALDAIARAGKKDRAAVLSALATTRDFQGALGTWSFDADGDISLKVMSGSTVRKGAFAFVKVLGR